MDSPQNPGLGVFSRLPPEIRLLIWNQLHPSQLSFLRASSQIFAEARKAAYEATTLTFHVSPRHTHRSWFEIATNLDIGLPKTIEYFQHAQRLRLKNFPWFRLELIRVEVEAPDPKDPGQIICIWKKCLDIAELLSCSSSKLKRLDIFFLASESSHWVTDQQPLWSLGDSKPTEMTEFDHEFVLMAFSRLRTLQAVDIHLPELCDKDDQQVLTDFICIVNGARQNPLQEDETFSQDNLDEVFFDIEQILDVQEGDTAKLMRLERYSSWYEESIKIGASRYEDQLHNVWRRRFRTRMQERDDTWRAKRIMDIRFTLMRYLNPKARYRWAWIGHLDFLVCLGKEFYAPPKSLASTERWDRELWWKHRPKGLECPASLYRSIYGDQTGQNSHSG